MGSLARTSRHLGQCASRLCTLLLDTVWLLRLCLRPRAALAAENLFLRTQLALYQAYNATPRRPTNATRFSLVLLAPWFDGRPALAVVQPETFTRWPRQGVCLFWRGTSCPGRPAIPVELPGLLRQMAHDNLTWGQRCMANERLRKLGLRVSPRTVRTYLPTHGDRAPSCRVPSQRWRTYLRQHAWDLLGSGVAVDLTRGLQAWSARRMRRLQCWWGQAVASRGQERPQRATVPMALLSETVLVPAAWSVETGHGIRVAERSPPAMGPPHTHDACTATRATQVDTVVVYPAVAALDRWERAGPHAWGIQSLHPGETRATPSAARGMPKRGEAIAGKGCKAGSVTPHKIMAHHRRQR